MNSAQRRRRHHATMRLNISASHYATTIFAKIFSRRVMLTISLHRLNTPAIQADAGKMPSRALSAHAVIGRWAIFSARIFSSGGAAGADFGRQAAAARAHGGRFGIY